MTATATEKTCLELADFARRARLARAISKDFGQGWMSRNARDMVRVAAFAGFDVQALTVHIATTQRDSHRQVNIATVLRCMQEIENDEVS